MAVKGVDFHACFLDLDKKWFHTTLFTKNKASTDDEDPADIKLEL